MEEKRDIRKGSCKLHHGYIVPLALMPTTSRSYGDGMGDTSPTWWGAAWGDSAGTVGHSEGKGGEVDATYGVT